MSGKRKHENPGDGDRSSTTAKKPKEAFSVGPANLPDGTYRRKVKKIKQDLIHKAKVKKSYAKIKQRELQDSRHTHSSDLSAVAHTEPAGLEFHPARQAMLGEPEKTQEEPARPEHRPRERRQKRPKPAPFSKEARQAQERKEEAERRRKAIEEANIQRQQKVEERERFRRAMAKARTAGRNGQRKLGRESKVLLEKVKRVVSE